MGIFDTITHGIAILNREVFQTAFSSELDFITKLLTVLVIGSLLSQTVYMLLPNMLKKKLQALDFNPEQGGISKTALLAIGAMIALTIIKVQRHSINSTDKTSENRIEKEFRHRKLFMLDMNTY